MRRFLLAFSLVLALCAPQLAHAAACSNPQAYTSSGSGSCTAPSGYNTVTIGAIGAGGNGASNQGGGGGGSCVITLSVTGGTTTIYYNVGANGTTGGTSWANIASNAQPSSAAQGCYATGGRNTGSNGSGTYGTDYNGGAGSPLSTKYGGGGGAGTGGNGGGGSGSSGGDGGAGGTLGVSGGIGSSTTYPGNPPGAGGSGITPTNGAVGEVYLSFTSVSTCSGSPLTLLGVGSC